MSPRIWLVRHGETEWSKVGRHTGRTDLPLTSVGEDQARTTATGMSTLAPSLVLCSPLGRARRTAELAGLKADDYDDDLMEFVTLQRKKADSDKSWTVDIDDVDTSTWDLSVKNPNGQEEVAYRSPADILDEIAELDRESAVILEKIRGLL